MTENSKYTPTPSDPSVDPTKQPIEDHRPKVDLEDLMERDMSYRQNSKDLVSNALYFEDLDLSLHYLLD